MATKAQIAKKMYNRALTNLSGGEKAAVTKAYNNQSTGNSNTSTTENGYVTVEFGRPGVNGIKKCAVKAGTNVETALAQSGFKINPSKEGVIEKSTGNVAMFKDAVKSGTLYFIVPGVDSSW